MSATPTLLSLAATAFYGIAVLGCGTACMTARANRQQRWHTHVWLAIAVVFIALILSRLFVVEDILRSDLRSWLRAEGLAADRRTWQGYVIAVVLMTSTLGGFYGLYAFSRKLAGKRNMAIMIAAASAIAMLILVGLRVISLHAMDQLLFGPLKLNWFGDLGATVLVTGSAIYYTRRVRSRS